MIAPCFAKVFPNFVLYSPFVLSLSKDRFGLRKALSSIRVSFDKLRTNEFPSLYIMK